MDTILKNHNSINNQEVKQKFVERHIYTCFSYEMAAILDSPSNDGLNDGGLPNWDDIENLSYEVCPVCSEAIEKDKNENYTCVCGYTAPDDYFLEHEYHEIYEWWIVSSFLYKHLKKRGYPVLEWGNNYYWGRCTTGQAILLDYVIGQICFEMEILEGQKYSWV